MIDLSHTRARLLAEIGATDAADAPLRDITDPRVATADACVRVSGNGRADLFSLLKVALLERFAAVPRPQFLQDLLIPLRNALGNAFKHGNGQDLAKAISVEIVLARKGALIAITDEGAGFDAALTFQRFQGRENYFERHGCGFRNLHRAASTVSYENGGRTLLLCFRPALQYQDRASLLPLPTTKNWGEGAAKMGGLPLHEPQGRARHSVRAGVMPPESGAHGVTRPTTSSPFLGANRGAHSVESLTKATDSAWIQSCLTAELPEFANGEARLESCRVYATRGPAGDDCGNRYVLRVAGLDGQPMETRVLTGRLHATEAAAATDFEAATRLHEAKRSKRLLIPKPVARLAGEPRLVLYDFDSWMNLWEFLTFRGSLKSLRHRAERVGQTLAYLHRSQVALRRAETDLAGEELPAMIARTETNLQTRPCGTELVSRFRACVQRLPERPAFRRQRILTPIHGALGWDCIHYGVDGRFYLYRFENCRQSHPGLDLGGFAADLLCFTLANYDEQAYGLCHDIFLDHYNSNSEHPMDEDDLRFYIAFALVERLQRADSHASVAQWLDALDAAIGNRHLESEVAS